MSEAIYVRFEVHLWGSPDSPSRTAKRVEKALQAAFADERAHGGDVAVIIEQHTGPCGPILCGHHPKHQGHEPNGLIWCEYTQSMEGKPRFWWLNPRRWFR